MKRSERIITAILTMIIGILLIAMQGDFIGLLMTVAGVCLIVLGVMDLFSRLIPPAVVKIVSGILVIVCGWKLIEAILYIAAALLLIAGILLLCDKLKKKVRCISFWQTVLAYATPVAFILIGAVFLIHQALTLKFMFILSGILTFAEGGILLANTFLEE